MATSMNSASPIADVTEIGDICGRTKVSKAGNSPPSVLCPRSGVLTWASFNRCERFDWVFFWRRNVRRNLGCGRFFHENRLRFSTDMDAALRWFLADLEPGSYDTPFKIP